MGHVASDAAPVVETRAASIPAAGRLAAPQEELPSGPDEQQRRSFGMAPLPGAPNLAWDRTKSLAPLWPRGCTC